MTGMLIRLCVLLETKVFKMLVQQALIAISSIPIPKCIWDGEVQEHFLELFNRFKIITPGKWNQYLRLLFAYLKGS